MESTGKKHAELDEDEYLASGDLFVTNRKLLITYGVYVSDHVFA